MQITWRAALALLVGAALSASVVTAEAADRTVFAGCVVERTDTTITLDTSGGETITIGFSQRRIAGSDWWKTLVQGVEDEAKRQGATVDVTDAGGDTVRQISDVRTLLSRQVDGVIINPNDPRGVSPAIQQATQADVPVVAVNSNLDKSLLSSAYCYVAEDQEATGALAGKAIAADVAAKFDGSDTVKMVTVGGYPGDVISDLRDNGFKQGFDAYFEENPDKEKPQVSQLPRKYGEWLPDKALPQMRDVATANPDLDVVYSESDVMHAGIKQALTQSGLYDKVLIASYDGGMNFIKEMVDNPEGPAQANASNQPYDQGVEAVRQIMAASKGTAKEESCPGNVKYIETIAVTPDTAKKYYDPDLSYVQSFGVE
jgi:ribose transport system substrate-binding protein